MLNNATGNNNNNTKTCRYYWIALHQNDKNSITNKKNQIIK